MVMTIFRTKPVEDVLAQDEGPQDGPGLRKRLGVFDLVGFGVGVVIGTGIFTLTGVQAKLHAGPAIVISFAIAGFVSVLAALCYAELASAVPTSGSAYSYAYATVGEIVAWVIGWDLILEFVLGASTVARGWSGYLQNLFSLPTSLFGETSTVNLGAILIVAFLAVIAVVGVKQSAWVTLVLVVVKVVICIFVIVAGFFYMKSSNLHPFIPPSKPTPNSGGLDRPVVNALFGAPSAFGIAGRAHRRGRRLLRLHRLRGAGQPQRGDEDPARDMPRGLIGTLIVATVLYLGVSLRADRHAEVLADQPGVAAVIGVRQRRRELGGPHDRRRCRLRPDLGDPRRPRRASGGSVRDGP